MLVAIARAAAGGRKGRSTMRRCRVAAILFACLCVFGVAASGQAADKNGDTVNKKADQRNHEPSLLTADDLTSDEQLSLVVARGHVVLIQGERKVEADVITYNQKSKVVIATGNVKMYEPSGEVIYTDYAELTDDLREGFMNQARMMMSDGSLVTGTEAERTAGRYTKMNHVTYTPCFLCEDHPGQLPVWELQATKGLHDNEDKDIRYTDAYIEMFGVPIFYAPYFSTPDPTVKRRSGFLTPSWGNNSALGFFFDDSYYYDISPDMDATFHPTYFSLQGPMLEGEFRERFEKGALTAAGGIIYADKTEAALEPPGVTPPKIWRGYFDELSEFDINDNWRWGSSVQLASDPNFLRQYYSDIRSVLESKAYIENFSGRDYFTIDAYHFQDLRPDNPQQDPNVAPVLQYSLLGEPGSLLGGRWSFDSGIVGLTRTSVGTDYTGTRIGIGPDYSRFSLEPGWSRQLTSDTGLLTTLTARARADLWDYQNYQRPDSWNLDADTLAAGQQATTVGATSGTAYRAFPQGQVKVSYPLVRNGDTSQQVIEPTVAYTAAPQISQKPIYPNEDSQDVELDATSLFALNRFVGQDRQEGGQRVTYGLRTGIFGFNEGSGSVFVGQDYRLTKDSSTVFDNTTGLSTQRSDYVGQVDLSPFNWMYLNYRTDYESETLRPRRETVTASFGSTPLSFSTTYSSDNNIQNPINYQLAKESYTAFNLNSQVSRYWTGTVSQSLLLSPTEEPMSTTLVLTYTDECLVFQSYATITWVTAPGAAPSQTVMFRLIFKGLGAVVSPGLSLNTLEGNATQ